MYTAFTTALSALNATSGAINVVGNNLANLNTTGFKDTTVSFEDLVTQSSGLNSQSNQVGFGVAPPLNITQFTQGAVQTSTGPLDAAIQGDGFFIVKDSNGAPFYTRDGSFQLDANGNLLTATGENVQGWTAVGATLNTSGAPSNIQLPVGQMLKAQPTTTFSLAMNLNANAANGSADATFSTPIQAVDSLGNPVVLTVTFTKDATTPNQWTYQVTVPGNTTSKGTAGTPTSLLTTPGTLTFDNTGTLTKPAATDKPVTLQITGLADGAADMNITWSPYDKNGQPTITQFGQPSAVSSNSQDGQAAAQLIKVGMSNNGIIEAQFSNGTQMQLAQLAVAAIENPSSMVSVGNNNYGVTAATALPAIGTAQTGGRGQIVGGSLEASTVDVATEFTNLIVLQRAYQANSKIITTVDQLSQDTINLVR